jgi:NTP pyrophosphatase (non-canonical NTP hydrolase)
MNKIQKETDKWIKQCGYGYFSPHEALARLMEETGELAREINHTFGPKKKKSTEPNRNVDDEMGDILFTLACIANPLKIDLDKAFDRVMKKLYTRDKDRYKAEKLSKKIK